jgi:hypothetical protein
VSASSSSGTVAGTVDTYLDNTYVRGMGKYYDRDMAGYACSSTR